ncbi:MAG TPA: barstar family protein [Verrucomicrobiae bacterium]|nr:barstar family protein [Verrucomicrobiae bacterium]
MPHQSATIDTKRISDWNSFHSVFSEVMGSPNFYGRNMDAWIDCMTNFDDGMTRFTIGPG